MGSPSPSSFKLGLGYEFFEIVLFDFDLMGAEKITNSSCRKGAS